MIKILASALIVVSGGFFGTSLCKNELNKIQGTEELHNLILHITTGIEKLSLPLSEIFSKYISESPNSQTAIFLSSHRGSYAEKLMTLAEKSCSSFLCMELKEFNRTIGTVDRDTQIKLAHSALLATEKELSKQRCDYTSKSKLYKTLSFLISCVIAVLLY